MTMPGARKLTIEDRNYNYLLKDGGHRLAGWAGRTIRLVVELRQGRYVSLVFGSKLWTDEHENNADCAPEHKASFTPADVRNAIAALKFHQGGELPAGLETGTWRLEKRSA